MTPLAYQATKLALAENDHASFDVLCGFQWFDVQAIEPMIATAVSANSTIEGPAGRETPPIGSRAHLPAKCSWFEAQRDVGRCAWVCTEMDDGRINIRLVTPTWRYPRVIIERGSTVFSREHLGWGKIDPGLGAEQIAHEVDAILAIVNQPGLVLAGKQRCDKRINRVAQLRGHAIGDDGLWTKYTIRPGRHGIAHGNQPDEPVMPLHHVRKHHKPRASITAGRDIWIDDFWRGDATLGVVHKTYFVAEPVKKAA